MSHSSEPERPGKKKVIDVLPDSYRLAIEDLTTTSVAAATTVVDESSRGVSSRDPRDISDASLLSLANEILSNFYDTKDDWLNIDDGESANQGGVIIETRWIGDGDLRLRRRLQSGESRGTVLAYVRRVARVRNVCRGRREDD